MAPGSEAEAIVRADLCARIDRLAAELPHLKPGGLAFAVDDIRRVARDHGFVPVADLARGLESAIAASGGATIVLPFLEAMSDAAWSAERNAEASRAYLASVGLRLHG
ncbi:MAG: hypothetical protein ACKVOP_10235 [Sphingomonadaceae bacterium]